MSRPDLEPGRVYRARDLVDYERLVDAGELIPLGHGLYAHPKPSRFGPVPPHDEEIMRVFLDDTPFVFTGPERWNALGLGTTAVFAVPLVYNTKRSGTFTFGNRSFTLRREDFPENPPTEWFVIDLLEHTDQAAASPTEVAEALGCALARGRFDRERLREMAKRYGSRATIALVEGALNAKSE